MKKFLRRIVKRTLGEESVRIIYEPNTVFDNELMANRTVLVTGAAGTIGRAISLEMLQQGASLVAVDIDEAGLEELKDQVEAEGGNLTAITADVGSDEEIDELCRKLDDAGLTVDVLVNNVGIHTNLTGALASDFENWRTCLETNLVGPYRLTRQIADRLVGRGIAGCVVFISSVHQWQVRGHPAYSASKAAVGIIVKELADEFARFGIRVNGVAPGAVAPEPGGKQRVLEHTPLHGTAIPPRYIGRAALYLASDYFSRHTTGSVIAVDSGLLARGFYRGNARAALERKAKLS